jgi:hypothetical protein
MVATGGVTHAQIMDDLRARGVPTVADTARALRLSWHASTAGKFGCDPCDECGQRPREGDRIWQNAYPDLMCDPCMDRNRED